MSIKAFGCSKRIEDIDSLQDLPRRPVRYHVGGERALVFTKLCTSSLIEWVTTGVLRSELLFQILLETADEPRHATKEPNEFIVALHHLVEETCISNEMNI